jgi:LEA14-like dessication related protein
MIIAHFKIHIISILIIIFTSLNSCSYQDINIGNPTDLKVEELNMKNIKLIIMVPIDNPNNFAFKIKSVNIDLFINGRKVGKINKIDKVRIPKNSKEIYPVPFEIETSDGLMNILAIFNDLQKGRPKIALKGNVKVGKVLINKKIKVNHEQFMDLY